MRTAQDEVSLTSRNINLPEDSYQRLCKMALDLGVLSHNKPSPKRLMEIISKVDPMILEEFLDDLGVLGDCYDNQD